MKNILKWLWIFLPVCVLAGCRENMPSDYLMRHPAVLKREIERCHADETKTREMASHCEIVMSAAERFIELLKEQQGEPEKFGVRIMEAQAACAKAGLAGDSADCHNVKILLAVVGVNSPE